MNSSISKTKTNFIEWINCERSAFYSFNAYSGKDLPYPDQAQKNQAYKVEEESTKLFPGIKKSHDFDFEINQSAPITVYQPTIKVEGNLEVRGDIIKKDIPSKENLKPKLYFTEQDHKKIEDLNLPSDYIVLAPASVWFTKQWPKDHWQTLLELLGGQNCYFIGAPTDIDFINRIIGKNQNAKKYF